MDPVLVLFLSWLALFHRGVLLGHVVDDVVRIKNMEQYRKEFRWTPAGIRDYIREGFYGAGLFADSRLDHAFNLLIHLFNSILIYSIASAQYSQNVGTVAALLYMCNPVNNQVSLWLNGRRYLITIFCALLSWKFKILGAVLFPFAAWLHVSGVAFPLLYLFSSEKWAILIGIGVAAAFGHRRIMAVLESRRSGFVHPKDGVNECLKVRPRKIVLYVKSVGWYVAHTILPMKPRMFHEFLYYFSRYPESMKEGYSLNYQFYWGLICLGGLGYEIFMGGPSAFWAGWFLLFISQWCNVYNVTMHTADRYCSLAGIGLMVLLASNVMLIPDPVIRACVFTAFIAVYVMKYLPLFQAYRTYGDFLRYHIWLEPSGVEARHIMALDYLNSPKPNPMSAYAVLRDGLRERPYDFKLLLVMSQTMFTIGQIENGLKILDKAEEVVPLGDEEDCRKVFAEHREYFRKVLDKQKRPAGTKVAANGHLAGAAA